MKLKKLVLNLAEALDPDHQGLGWPDPIKWDGRPLREMIPGLMLLAELKINDFPEPEWRTERERNLVDALSALEAHMSQK